MTPTPASKRRSATRLRRALLPGLAMLVLLAGACSGSDAPPPAAATEPTPTPVSDVLGARAPLTLPVTPVNIQYEIVDPAFEALPGARALFGTHAGAGYQIEVPDRWNGDVVYFAHGFRGNPPQLTVTAPPLREFLIGRGYAWAASSYSKNGYEPGVAARDMYALRDVVAREIGAPHRSYFYGQSMGGHVVTLSLEQYPDAYDGALTECGVVSGHDILDYFLSWGALAAYVTNTELYEVSTLPNEFGSRIAGSVLPALGPKDEPTAAGRVFASAIENLTGGPRPFFREGYDANFEFNFAILVNAVGAAGPANAAAQNADTAYRVRDGLSVTSDQINREIERLAAHPSYRDPATYPEFADMTGKIATPLLTLHNTGDLFVPISLEQEYRRLTQGAGTSDLLVQRAIRRDGHCNFTEAERRDALEDLFAWVENGVVPAGDDLLGNLASAGSAFTLPLEPDDPGGTAAP